MLGQPGLPPLPFKQGMCSLSGQPFVDLNATINWVQCDTCQRWIHFHCANDEQRILFTFNISAPGTPEEPKTAQDERGETQTDKINEDPRDKDRWIVGIYNNGVLAPKINHASRDVTSDVLSGRPYNFTFAETFKPDTIRQKLLTTHSETSTSLLPTQGLLITADHRHSNILAAFTDQSSLLTGCWMGSGSKPVIPSGRFSHQSPVALMPPSLMDIQSPTAQPTHYHWLPRLIPL